MPEIRGTLTRDGAGPMRPCLWCTEPTDTMAETPGRPDLGEVPLHVWCAGEVIVAYRRLTAPAGPSPAECVLRARPPERGSSSPTARRGSAGYEARLNELDIYREANLPVPAQPVVEPINATAVEIRYAIAFLDEIAPSWRQTVADAEAKIRKVGRLRAGEGVDPDEDPTSARGSRRRSLEAFGGYTVVAHDDGCLGAASGDMKLCRCVPRAQA
jgi:hypothetical protein